MARAGLGDTWHCLFANDFDQMKVSTYETNWGRDDIRHADVAKLTLPDLPNGTVDLAWASFPCRICRWRVSTVVLVVSATTL